MCLSNTPKTTPPQLNDDMGEGYGSEGVGGGGVGVSLLDQASHNYIMLLYCRFERAWGERDGTTHILIQHLASNNTIKIVRSEYIGNVAEEDRAKAASFLSSSPSPSTTSPHPVSNRMLIIDCNFVNNNALVGGAFQLNFSRGSPLVGV